MSAVPRATVAPSDRRAGDDLVRTFMTVIAYPGGVEPCFASIMIRFSPLASHTSGVGV
jgi:hypothetical protein